MSEHPIPAVQQTGNVIADHMDAILALFKPGRKITILVRSPEAMDHSQDLVMTNDDLSEAAAAIQRRRDPNGTLRGEA